jgi:hypothetical protein
VSVCYRAMGGEEYDRVTKGLDRAGEEKVVMAVKLPERLKQLEVIGLKDPSGWAFVDTHHGLTYGGWHHGRLGCVTTHDGTVWVQKEGAPKAYDLPRFMTANEVCHALGLGEVAEVARGLGMHHKDVSAVCGRTISWWSADVVVETLEAVFPSLFNVPPH